MAVDRHVIARVGMRDRAKVLAFVRAIVRDADMAEDVLQEVHMLAIEKADQIESEAVLPQWLRGAAKRIALKHLRDRSRRPMPLSEQAIDALDRQWAKLDAETPAEPYKALEHCLDKLAPDARRIITMRYAERMRGVQIAERLGRTPASFYVTLSRIHARLESCVRSWIARAEP